MKYIIKRKYFGALDAVTSTAGGVVEGTGKVLDNTLTKTAAGVGGALAAPAIGSAIGGVLGGPAGAFIGGMLGANPIGMGVAGLGTAAATGAVGGVLKSTGQAMQ